MIVGQNDWLGGLVGSGLLLPLYPSTAVKRQFPQYTLDAFSYGIALKKLYGAPYAFENVALVVNTGLVKLPRTFAELERRALAFKKRKTRQPRHRGAAGALPRTPRCTCTRSSRV